VVNVDWRGTMAYCRWLTETTGKVYRRPSEAEWEKAARGTDGRIYPWGEGPPDENRCNYWRNIGGTTPIGRYSPGGDSPYGCTDMAGNVWEWTRSLWGKKSEEPDFKYPYDLEDGREDMEASDSILRVLRGGSWYSDRGSARVSYRSIQPPDYLNDDVGFRVCVAAQQE